MKMSRVTRLDDFSPIDRAICLLWIVFLKITEAGQIFVQSYGLILTFRAIFSKTYLATRKMACICKGKELTGSILPPKFFYAHIS
jgi:hypothetical protein